MLREGRVDALDRPWSGLPSEAGDKVCLEDREVALWKERREPEVVGRPGVSWEPESEVEEVVERFPASGSGLLRGIMRGLGAAEGFSLAARL
jgi:hypothetical protein